MRHYLICFVLKPIKLYIADAELSPKLQIDLKYQRPIGFILVHGNIKNGSV